MALQPCPACGGARLRPESLAVTVGGLSIDDYTQLSARAALEWIGSLELTETERAIAKLVVREVEERLTFLVSVGIGYLTLERAATTLSGGEAQRIRLATQIGSSLVGVLYILDEPSIGLHQRDNAKLIATLERLRDLGNTVIVVEHDEGTMRAADYLVDLGPGAGEHGGRIVAAGTPAQVIRNPASLTGRYLSGKLAIPVPAERRAGPRRAGRPRRPRAQPQGRRRGVPARDASTCVTGVSGSGKSTLVNETLYRSVANRLHRARSRPGAHDRIEGLEADRQGHQHRPVADRPDAAVQPGDLHRRLRPHPPALREDEGGASPRLSAGTVQLQRQGRALRGLQGRRADQDRDALPARTSTCPASSATAAATTARRSRSGSRASRSPTSSRCRSRRRSSFFANIPKIHRRLKTLHDVGLDYIRLGQPATTLSGGEAQRVKLATELSKIATGETLYILDEPTTGLHFADVERLLDVLSRLVDAGNTVVVIEHNLDVIKSADWIVDLGPEGGDGGGEIIATGTPEQVATEPGSYTGRFLEELVEPKVERAAGEREPVAA